MTTKILSVALVVFFLLLGACRNSERNTSISAAVDHEQMSDNPRHPYYYGLIEEYRIVLSQDPNNLAANVALANAYMQSGAWREAIRQYEEALRIDPRNADVHTDMGSAFRNMGMPDRALAEYRKALEYEPGHLGARYQMGLVYAYDFHNYPLAIHIWEELLRIAPNHPQADYMRTCLVTFRKAVKKDHF